MFTVDNRTPYAADRTAVIDKDGRVLWVVVVKATWDIGPGGALQLAEEQPPPVLVPEYAGEDGASSLRHETDLVPPKQATDVLVIGSAHAPHGRPTTEFTAGFEVAGLRKFVTVRGDRTYEMSVAGVVGPSRMTPVVSVPLSYERAYGGFDDKDPDPQKQLLDGRNPVGAGVATRPEHLIGKPVPNFEYPGKDIAKAGPAGFGPLAVHWQPRASYAGTYDAHWVEHRKPLLPADFDERHFQAAPVDQQLPGRLPLQARMSLVNLSPRGDLSFELPRVYLRFLTELSPPAKEARREHAATLNTIIADTDTHRLHMVWSTVLDCGRDVDHIVQTRVTEKEHIT
mgnify:CR=1 FL=1